MGRMPATFVAFCLGFGLALFAFCAKAQAVECKFSGPDGAPATDPEWRVFLLHQSSELYRAADTECRGELRQADVQAYLAGIDTKVSTAMDRLRSRQAVGKTVKVKKDGTTIPSLLASNKPDEPKCAQSFWLVRESYEDITIFGCPKTAKQATGASFGFSSDQVLNNDSWSAKGVVSRVFRQFIDPPQDPFAPYFSAFAFAPSVKFNRLTNSNETQKSKEVDVLSFSATGEFAFGNVLWGTQYLRARAAYNTGFESETDSWSATAEWQPLHNRKPGEASPSISAPNTLGPLVWQIDPILRLQYSEQVAGSTSPIFDENDYALRLGPVAVLTIRPKADELYVPEKLQDAIFALSYQWLTDLASNNEYDLFGASLTLPLDQAGHFGLKVSYQKGEVEETGQEIDQTQVGLSAKW